MNKILIIGNSVACRAHLVILINEKSKAEHGLVISDLAKTDTMSFHTAEKCSSERVIKALSAAPQNQGTIIYLELMQSLIKAYMLPETLPEERIFNALYSVFFARIWKQSLINAKSESLKNHQSLSENFITSNCFACIEINMHSLINFLIFCRDKDKPEIFLPTMMSSQPCEAFFRTFRSMTATESTVVNFNMLDLLYRAKRAHMIGKLEVKLPDFKFSRKNYEVGSPAIFSKLPSDEIINSIAEKAYKAAVMVFAALGNIKIIMEIY